MNLPLAQFYAVGYDMMRPYNVAGGMQDNGSVRGPGTKRAAAAASCSRTGKPSAAATASTTCSIRSRTASSTTRSQFGSLQRVDLYTGESKSIASRDQSLRFNWNAPVLVSPHDSNVVYHGANVLLKSAYRGEGWTEISPDLTTNDKAKLTTGKGGDGNVTYCTITTIDESPIVRDLLWVGTDDGNVQVSKDGGKTWTKLNDRIPGNPGYWVSRVVASSHAPGTAYVTLTGLRNDDFRAFVYKTTDYGQTWVSIAGNLPASVAQRDPRGSVQPDLLFAGSDTGLFVTIDGGRTWQEMKNGLPTQPVHDLKIHPARAGLDRGHARPRDLHHRHLGARGVVEQDVGAGLLPLRRRVEGEVDRAPAERCRIDQLRRRERTERRRDRLLPEGARAGRRHREDRAGLAHHRRDEGPERGRPQPGALEHAGGGRDHPGPACAATLRPRRIRRRRGFGGPQAQPVYPTFGGTIPAEVGEYTVVVLGRRQHVHEEGPDPRRRLVRPDVLIRGPGGVRLDRDWSLTPLAVESTPSRRRHGRVARGLDLSGAG